MKATERHRRRVAFFGKPRRTSKPRKLDKNAKNRKPALVSVAPLVSYTYIRLTHYHLVMYQPLSAIKQTNFVEFMPTVVQKSIVVDSCRWSFSTYKFSSHFGSDCLCLHHCLLNTPLHMIRTIRSFQSNVNIPSCTTPS